MDFYQQQRPLSSKNRMLELEHASNAAFDKLMRALRRVKFDPQQQRDDQGRWSNTGSNGLADLSTVFAQGGPDDSWESVASSFDGVNVVEQLVTNRDGSAIRSEYTSDPASPWDERHTVATPDGTRISFENSGATQTIRDASTGRVISAATWTADGAQREATVQNVLDPRAYAAAKTFEAAGALFIWMSGQNSTDSIAILSFNAAEYAPGINNCDPAIWVGKLTKEQTDAACPRHGEVQSLTDYASEVVTQEGNT